VARRVPIATTCTDVLAAQPYSDTALGEKVGILRASLLRTK
jgi:hypothetical protein